MSTELADLICGLFLALCWFIIIMMAKYDWEEW